MSNDLISRSKLLEHMENWAFQECPVGIDEPESDVYRTIKEAIKMIQEQPTAFDVDKVVEQLEEKSKQYENPASGNKEFVQYCKGIFTGYKYAIDDMKEIGRGQQA